MQQHLPVVATSTRIRANAFRHGAQQPLHKLRRLREELLRLQASRRVAGRHGRPRQRMERTTQAVRRRPPRFHRWLLRPQGTREYCDDTAVRIACARDAHQHRLVFRDRCHVTAQPVDADRGLRGGGAERVLLVCRPRACGRGYGGHRRRRWVAALADLGRGRGPHAAVDRPDPGQRAAVRADHRGTDGTGPARNAQAAERLCPRELGTGALRARWQSPSRPMWA